MTRTTTGGTLPRAMWPLIEKGMSKPAPAPVRSALGPLDSKKMRARLWPRPHLKPKSTIKTWKASQHCAMSSGINPSKTCTFDLEDASESVVL